MFTSVYVVTRCTILYLELSWYSKERVSQARCYIANSLVPVPSHLKEQHSQSGSVDVGIYCAFPSDRESLSEWNVKYYIDNNLPRNGSASHQEVRRRNTHPYLGVLQRQESVTTR